MCPSVCVCVIYVEPAESSRSTLLLCLLSRYFCLLFTFAASSPSRSAVARPCTSLHVDFMCVFPIGQSAKRAKWGKTWWMAAPLPHPTHSSLHFTSITAFRLLQHNCFSFFFSFFSLFYWAFSVLFERMFCYLWQCPKVTVSKTMWMLLIAEKIFWKLKYTTKIIKNILQEYLKYSKNTTNTAKILKQNCNNNKNIAEIIKNCCKKSKTNCKNTLTILKILQKYFRFSKNSKKFCINTKKILQKYQKILQKYCKNTKYTAILIIILQKYKKMLHKY